MVVQVQEAVKLALGNKDGIIRLEVCAGGGGGLGWRTWQVEEVKGGTESRCRPRTGTTDRELYRSPSCPLARPCCPPAHHVMAPEGVGPSSPSSLCECPHPAPSPQVQDMARGGKVLGLALLHAAATKDGGTLFWALGKGNAPLALRWQQGLGPWRVRRGGRALRERGEGDEKSLCARTVLGEHGMHMVIWCVACAGMSAAVPIML